MDFSFSCLFLPANTADVKDAQTPCSSTAPLLTIVLLTIPQLRDVPRSLQRAGSITEPRTTLPGRFPEPGHPLPKGKPSPVLQAAAAPSHPSPLPSLKGSLQKG